jgi:hypothetical protein
MKKIICIILILVLLAVSFLQPLWLVSAESFRFTIHLGKSVPLQSVAEVAGGYKCYVNDREYFFVSTDKCELVDEKPLRAKFSLGRPIFIYRGKV